MTADASSVQFRHRVVCGGAAVIAVKLIETAHEHGHGLLGAALAALTVLPLLLSVLLPLALRRDLSPFTLATAAVVTLSAQTAVAIIEFESAVQPTALLFTTLAVSAVYRTQRVLLATGVLVAFAQIGVTLLSYGVFGLPRLSDRPGDDSTTVLIVATVVGAWALLLVWRDHRAAEAFAVERDQVTATYRDVLPMVSIHLDRAGRVLDANRMTCLLLDLELDAIVGRDWFTLALPPEYQAPGRAFFERAAEGEHVLGEAVQAYTNEIVGADGHRRTVEWSAGWIVGPDGIRTSLLAVGRDITAELAARADADRARREMDALRHLAQKVASLDDSRQAIVDGAASLPGVGFAAIAEPDREGGALIVSTSSAAQARGADVAIDAETPIAEAYRTARTVITDRGTRPHGLSTSVPALDDAALVVHQPVVGADGVMAVLALGWAADEDSERDRGLTLTALIAHEVAVSLRRRESIKVLERAALLDPLTGVANRRAFDAELAVGLRRAEASGEPLSLAVLDLNQFKAVNDTQGHDAGDDLLASCAAAWTDVLRRGDLLARLGGDEFALLLPSCGERELADVIDRIRRATPHAPGTAIGGTTWACPESAAAFVRRADAEQYADKRRCHARARTA